MKWTEEKDPKERRRKSLYAELRLVRIHTAEKASVAPARTSSSGDEPSEGPIVSLETWVDQNLPGHLAATLCALDGNLVATRCDIDTEPVLDQQ